MAVPVGSAGKMALEFTYASDIDGFRTLLIILSCSGSITKIMATNCYGGSRGGGLSSLSKYVVLYAVLYSRLATVLYSTVQYSTA
jgi:hypothetical protein